MSIHTVPTTGRLWCAVCRIMRPLADMDRDFGYDAWGRRYGAGICRLCALPGTGVMSEEDEMSIEVRG